MCRVDENWSAGGSAYPSAGSAAAWEDDRINLALFDHADLKIVIERGRGYGLPIGRAHVSTDVNIEHLQIGHCVLSKLQPAASSLVRCFKG